MTQRSGQHVNSAVYQSLYGACGSTCRHIYFGWDEADGAGFAKDACRSLCENEGRLYGNYSNRPDAVSYVR